MGAGWPLLGAGCRLLGAGLAKLVSGCRFLVAGGVAGCQLSVLMPVAGAGFDLQMPDAYAEALPRRRGQGVEKKLSGAIPGLTPAPFFETFFLKHFICFNLFASFLKHFF